MATRPEVDERVARALERLMCCAEDYARAVVDGEDSFNALRALLDAIQAARAAKEGTIDV